MLLRREVEFSRIEWVSRRRLARQRWRVKWRDDAPTVVGLVAVASGWLVGW
uniref:Uncharacterized protein n=1 Tax=Setaria italica TaxID=4555 RepID=K3Y0U7_SETIT